MQFEYSKHSPWWNNKSWQKLDVTLQELHAKPLQYHHPLLNDIPTKPGVIIFRGPRRIGKTTFVKQAIAKILKQKKAKPKNILFYPCNRIIDYNQLYDLITGYLGTTKDHNYLFLDEITFVKEWQRTIKDLVDSGDLKNTTLFLTGSNALDLQYSSEKLPGRRGQLHNRDLTYLPLSFADFAGMVRTKHKLTTSQLFADYLLCGGFPQAINQYYNQGFISNHLYETYLTWIEGDFHKEGKSDVSLYAILEQVIKHLGSTTSWYIIAKNTGITSHSTVSDYLDILEKIFASFTLYHYSINEKKILLNKNKKIFFLDPLIFHAINAKVNGFTDQFFTHAKHTLNAPSVLPKLIENIVGSHLYIKQSHNNNQLYYGKYQQKEIDFVTKAHNQLSYYEVKYQKHPKISNFSFWDKDQPLNIITPNFSLNKSTLHFQPITDFLLNLS